ncbi:permease prefix domain 1-containing protein [Pseudidiomarina sp.]|uniref:permease prefix domain 1-containing protein n=1 Tax=Pseudidiomarina sp. TaxID=2081707 RepID=UPI003A97DE97
MMAINRSDTTFDIETSIGQWRAYVLRHAAIHADDADELESHLRDQIDALMQSGLHSDEAFMVATKRIGNLQAVSSQYAEVHSGRLWQNLVFTTDNKGWVGDFIPAFWLAFAAALAFQLPTLFGVTPETHEWFFARTISLFCLPFLAAYWVIKRDLGTAGWLTVIGVSAGAFIIMNALPWQAESATSTLAVMHIPMALWFLVGVMYTGNWWRTDARRMDFIRFSGEYAIYFVLIALGGGILTAFTVGMFSFIGLDLAWFAQQWIIPCGAMGAVVIVGWLVEAKQGAIENMAPVLARIFTPLFTLLLLAFLVVMLMTGRGFDVQRDVLIGLDLMLVLVLGLVLYAVSSRDPGKAPSLFDCLQLLLVSAALCVDLLALGAISGRIFELGVTPNRVAALGENLILLVSLSGYAWHYVNFVRNRSGFAALERWQTGFIPVYVMWAVIVVAIFPLVFGF